MNSCTACGNALHECECDGRPTRAAIVVSQRSVSTAKPRRTMWGRWNEHRAGCAACRSDGYRVGLCARGRRLYFGMLRDAGKRRGS